MGIMDQMNRDKALDNLPNLTRYPGVNKVEEGPNGYPRGEQDLDEKGRWNSAITGDFRVERISLFENDDETFNLSMNLVTVGGDAENDRFRLSFRFNPDQMDDTSSFPGKMQRQELSALIKLAKANDLIDADADYETYDDGVRAAADALVGGIEGWTLSGNIKLAAYKSKAGEFKGPFANLGYFRNEPVSKGEVPF